MGNANRQRGDYFERQCRGALEAAGWVVVRSAGSLGPADLVAVRRNSEDRPHVLLISCKVDGRASPAERARLLEVADQAAAEPLLASRPSRGSIELASMIDRPMVRATLHPPTRQRKPKGEADAQE
jgi:Holliday junction resolvase